MPSFNGSKCPRPRTSQSGIRGCVARLMREMGVPRYEFTPQCVRYPKNAVEKAIASSFRPNTNENE